MVNPRALRYRLSLLTLTQAVALRKMRNLKMPVYKRKVWLKPGGIVKWLLPPSLWICVLLPFPLLLLSVLGRCSVRLLSTNSIPFTIVEAFLLVSSSSSDSPVILFNNLLKSSPSSTSNSIFKTLKRYLLSDSILACYLFYVGLWNILIVPLFIKPSLVI